MGFWPDGAVTRDVVETALESPLRWRIEWCDGARREPTEGTGPTLPDGVLAAIPTRAKQRKIDRGLERDRTWIFAYLSDQGGHTMLDLHEGP